ncbi:cell wall-binding repeat-containing protein [Bacillus sp. es.034]|uniref:cell wall-binding repeat-containing protein n=1 Tax=Bacillus sp. es.034 TaxID=1761763 RepID=UPI000BF84A1B|nr:cell wall-binding repeat-containing protein [Bacillus sp. es.034]PFG04558.1 putative cell wall-binding protein [Bacillus sp. es.034]
MKKVLSIFCMMTMLVLIMNNRAPVEASGSQGNTMEDAVPILLDQENEGTLETTVDVDYYRFNLDKAGNTVIRFNRAEGATWNVEITDKDGHPYTHFFTRNHSGVTGYEEVSIGLPAGEHFIKVSTEEYQSKGVPYTFIVQQTANDFYEKEFNDKAEAASAMQINRAYKGQIQAHDDIDYFTFTLNRANNVALSIDRYAQGSWNIKLVDENGKEYVDLDTDYNFAEYGPDEERLDLPAGTYYVRIENNWGTPGMNYAFKVQELTDRIQGAKRFDTAVGISQHGWKTSDTVVLVSGNDFPDALAGGPLAYYHNAPVLLTDQKQLPIATWKEVQRLKAKKVIILGGEGAVSSHVTDELKYLGISVKRIGGKDRYETAAFIAKEIPSTKAVVANGKKFPDALSVAPYASKNSIPILLTDESFLPDVTKKALASKASSIVVGGAGAVSELVESQLPNPVRYGGKDRYETAKLIINHLPVGKNAAYVATGKNFPDALAGAALAAKHNVPILLVSDQSIPTPTQSLLRDYSRFILWGGPGAVADKVVDALDNSLVQIQ